MASGSFDFLTRRHGVKVDSAVNVEECSLGIGEVIGTENILSASRMQWRSQGVARGGRGHH